MVLKNRDFPPTQKAICFQNEYTGHENIKVGIEKNTNNPINDGATSTIFNCCLLRRPGLPENE